MFKKLKEKITEEVKISPQRFAEFTQSVSDRLQNSTNSDDNFFSIGDDDSGNNAATAASGNDHGFSSVALVSPTQESRARRASTSSMASDVSFLPRYEPSNMYHLQSDLDASASEMEDNVSTASSQLGHLSKEQIYLAFQKSQSRYHKYRGRYTDLTRHYKDLERENSKMKAILVETQDKAIRRVSELKEQCNLEQKAKAHLESSLRNDIDEKDYKIKSLQTKIELLQKESKPPVESQSNDVDSMENLTNYLNDARKEIENLNAKIQEMKASSIVFQTKEQEYKIKVANLEKEIAQFSEREKENNFKLAQSKMDLHNEILSKDMDLSNLKKENEILKQNLEAESKTNANVKLENLQSQNKKLIEKVEALMQKSVAQENDLMKIEIYKMEIQDLKQNEASLQTELATMDRVNAELTREATELAGKLSKEKDQYEAQIAKLREDAKKGLLSLEPKIKEKLQKEYQKQVEDLKNDFALKLEELSSSSGSLKELQLQALGKDGEIKKYVEELGLVKSELAKKTEAYKELESNHLELIEDAIKLRKTISDWEKEKLVSEAHAEKITRLEAHITTLQEEAKSAAELHRALQETTEKLRILEEKNKAAELDSSESKILELKLRKLEEEQSNLLSEFEAERQTFNDMLGSKNDAQEKQRDIEELEKEVDRLKEVLAEQQEENARIHEAKLKDEARLKKLEEQIRVSEEKEQAVVLEKSEYGLLQLKFRKLETEHKQMLESFTSDLEALKHDLTPVAEKNIENMLINSENNVKEKFDEIRRFSELKGKENEALVKKNSELRKILDTLSEKLKILEEKLENVQMGATESKLLELKIQKLKEERDRALKELEVEKKNCERLLENQEEIIEKKESIRVLENDLLNLKTKISELEAQVSEEKEVNLRLVEEKLELKREVTSLQEKIRVLEEKETSLSVFKTQCGILELKLEELVSEKQSLLKTFEVDKTNFLKHQEHSAAEASQLHDEISSLKSLLETGKAEAADLNDKINHHKEAEARFSAKTTELKAKLKLANAEIIKLRENLNASTEKSKSNVDSITSENERLRSEIEEKERTVSELSNNLESLSQVIEKQTVEFNSLLSRTQQLETVLEKMRIDSAEAIKQEKEHQNELTVRIQQLHQELAQKTEELAILNKKVIELEKLYSEEKSSLQEKLRDIAAAEGRHKTLNEEQQAALAELAKLKSTKRELKQTIMQLRVGEQENKILQEEKLALLGEIEDLRSRVVDVDKDNNELKAQLALRSTSAEKLHQVKHENEALKVENEKQQREIDQLSLRVQQVSADNSRTQSLIDEADTLKVKLEVMEKEMGEFESVKEGLEKEKVMMRDSLKELKERLLQLEKENESLEDKLAASSSDSDVTRIQQELVDIKTKYDNVFVENENLKAEYMRLEVKCEDFGKVKGSLEAQIAELESHYNEIMHEKQLLQDEIEELKTSPVNVSGGFEKEKSTSLANTDQHKREIEILRDKLTKYKSLDLTNKSSIEFYENELQKTKNANDKLSRKLDETLVTLNHCAELSTSTEVEYLRNVLYNYMLGKESMVLARVIAAVCKFDAQQTETILQKEQQKQTLLGQLGLM